jgi:hypothetical protein
MPLPCPHCAQPIRAHGGLACLPLGRVLSLLGGLLIAVAFFIPWLAVTTPQGTGLLSGDFLNRFLSGANPAELRRMMPGFGGTPAELQGLRTLVLLFPTCGALAALLALGAALGPQGRTPLNLALALCGILPLLAAATGLGLLPAAARPELGLGLIAAGGLAVLLGIGVDLAMGRKQAGNLSL